jgi:uncharacterized protein YceK
MSRSSLFVLCLAATVPLLSGCGAFFNCLWADKAGPRAEQGSGKIYGGVRFECEAFLQPPSTKEELLGACVLAVDLPLCAVADTLTLPFTISYTLKCQALAKERQADLPDPIPVSESREIKRQDGQQ